MSRVNSRLVDYDESSPRSIEKHGERLIGKTLKTVNGRKEIPSKFYEVKQSKITKGSFGMILEKYYYGINPPNTSEPDSSKTH